MPDPTRKLTVLSLNPEPAVSRDTWSLYEITVADEAGTVLGGSFRTFEKDIAIGSLVEYEITRRDHDTYGTSFTLKTKGKGKGGNGGLGKSVDDLRARVEVIEARLGINGQAAAPAPAPVTDVPAFQPQTPVAASPATADDDIPF